MCDQAKANWKNDRLSNLELENIWRMIEAEREREIVNKSIEDVKKNKT